MEKSKQILPIKISSEIKEAQLNQQPVVALESTVITHGLPYPENITLAHEMEVEIRNQASVPATIAILGGEIIIGVSPDQLERLAQSAGARKLSSRDLAPAIVKKEDGGTTVAATAFLAHLAGIRLFATGGIGGVHRGNPFDISADLYQLAITPVVVVCAGAKAILDIAATLEMLETLAIPVIGYLVEEFPAFYSTSSGHRSSGSANSPEEVAAICRWHWELGMQSAVLVAQPLPEEAAISKEYVEESIQAALTEAGQKGISGQAVTPFLLERVSALTSGASLRANLELLKNNARLAAQIACRL